MNRQIGKTEAVKEMCEAVGAFTAFIATTVVFGVLALLMAG